MNDTDLREVLLRTTSRLFQQHGYAAVSLRLIAAEAGVTTGSLYYYFSDKEEIVREILDTGHRRVQEDVERVIAALGPDASRAIKIRAGMRAHLAALFEPDSFPAANIRIYAHVPEHVRIAVRPGRRSYERLWTELLTDSAASSRPQTPPRHLAMFFFGAANWSFDWHREGRETLDEIATDLANLFLGCEVPYPVQPKTSSRRAARSTRAPSRQG